MRQFLWIVLGTATAVRAVTLAAAGAAAASERHRWTIGFLMIPVHGAAFVLDAPGAAAGAALAATDKEPRATVAGVLGVGLAVSFVSQLAAFYRHWYRKD